MWKQRAFTHMPYIRGYKSQNISPNQSLVRISSTELVNHEKEFKPHLSSGFFKTCMKQKQYTALRYASVVDLLKHISKASPSGQNI